MVCVPSHGVPMEIISRSLALRRVTLFITPETPKKTHTVYFNIGTWMMVVNVLTRRDPGPLNIFFLKGQ